MDRHRLLPAALRGPAAAVAVTCFAAVVALGLPMAGESTAGPADRAVTSAVDRLFELLPGLARPLSYATLPAVMAGVVVVLVVIALRLRRPRVAVLAVAAPVVTAALNTWVLKPLFDRVYLDYLAYPSGHTGTLVSILAVIALVATGSAAPGTRLRVAVGFGAAGLALTAVATAAIVGSDYHYPSDVLGALFWAIGTAVTIATIIDLLAARVRPVGDARSGAGRSRDIAE